MPMYSLSKYSAYSLKTSGILWQSDRNGRREADDAAVTVSKPIKSKVKIIGETLDAGNIKDIEIAK